MIRVPDAHTTPGCLAHCDEELKSGPTKRIWYDANPPGPIVSMPESTLPIPVCPIHATFMVPRTPEEMISNLQGLATCFRCANLDCEFFYVYDGASEGYYRLDPNGRLRRYLTA